MTAESSTNKLVTAALPAADTKRSTDTRASITTRVLMDPPSLQKRKIEVSDGKRYINIPEGKIGRLERRGDENGIKLYVQDFTSSTIIFFISAHRISLLHFDSILSDLPPALKREHLLTEMEWVSQDDDCGKVIIQPPLGNQYPSAFTTLEPFLRSQFVQHNVSSHAYALSLSWKVEDEYEIRCEEVFQVERHPLENALLRALKQKQGSIVPRVALNLNPLIFTGTAWQTDYHALSMPGLSEKAKAFLASAKQEHKASVNLATVPPAKVSSDSLALSPWAELKKALVKKKQFKKNNRGKAKAKARIAKIIPYLEFDEDAIIKAGFSFKDALDCIKQLEESHQEAENLLPLKNQLEEALAAADAILSSLSTSLKTIHVSASSQTESKEEKREVEELKSLSPPVGYAGAGRHAFFGQQETKNMSSSASVADQKKKLPESKNDVAFDADHQFTSLFVEPHPSHIKSVTTLTRMGGDGPSTSAIDKAVKLIETDETAAVHAFSEILSSTSENTSDFIMAAYHLGLCYRMNGKVKEAKIQFDRAIALLQREDLMFGFVDISAKKQFLSICYVERSKVFKLLNDERQEEENLQRAIEICVENYWAYNALGLLRQRQNEWVEAEECYNKAINYNSHYATPCCNLGLLLERRGQHAEAIKYYDKAISLAPNIPLYYNNRGLVKQALNLLQEAQEDFERVIELDSDYVSAHINLAVNDLQRGYPRKAILALEQHLSLDPTNIKILANLSSAYLKNEDSQQAISKAKQLLHIDPTHLAGWINLVSAYIFAGRYEAALIAWESLMHYSEGNDDTNLGRSKYSLLGQILRRFKYYEEAIHAYEAVLRYSDTIDKKAEAYFNLGNLYFDERNYEKALEYYKKAYAIWEDPLLKQYMQEAQEGIDDPDIFLPASRNLDNQAMLRQFLPEEKNALEEKLKAIHPGTTTRENVSYEEGLPFHDLLMFDEVSMAKSAKIRKLFFNPEEGLWYQCRYPGGRPKKANSEMLYNFIVTQNEANEIEIVYGRVGHFHLSKDKNVIFAGEIWFKDGKIGMWNNASGHFKPDSLLAPQVAALSQLPLDKFESLDKLKARLSLDYKKFCNNLRLMIKDTSEKNGDKRILRSMRSYYKS